MKFFKYCVLLITAFLFFSCKSENKKAVNSDSTQTQVTDSSINLASDTTLDETTATLGKEYTSKYICPMHCKNSGSDKPGYCPVCGMQYIENPDYHKK